ncbi:SDR family NAD(P)-dependent oxidoreductase, partial [Escherichia coli]|uniref:SDR family NAD(P)-dependent oxidoreductase n=1 Tax=Escherichia coli TaxID=562 RepID=UPI0034E5AD9C
MSDTHPVVLITGSARRIGAAIARQFHACGWSVVLHANTSSAELQQAAFDFDNVRPGSVLALQADLRDADALADLVEQAVTHFGRLDALVNNASNFFPTPLGQVTAEAMDELYAVNARAPLLLSQAAAPYLRRQQGSIVNLTDLHGTDPMRDH